MKIVYVAHPFTGDPEDNMRKINAIMQYLTLNYPDICFISPLHNFSYDKDAKEADILPRCFALLSKCDDLWVFGNWEHSSGCRQEINQAKLWGMTVLFGGIRG
ncbi:MAG: DUF4406 domain-containing protein [Chlamydiales bacterium]|nr:DUF4406 domain-containing protein [Chlamydiales bacterium]